jgi:hypothetical protein
MAFGYETPNLVDIDISKLRYIVKQNGLLANTESLIKSFLRLEILPPWLIQKGELGWKSCPHCHSLIYPVKG